MKTNRFSQLIEIVLLLMLSGCRNRDGYPFALRQAERYVMVAPDSALMWLSKMKDGIGDSPREVRMYYYLLTTKVQDKLMIRHISDSLMKEVVMYYEDTDNRNLLPEAYYYLASVYRDMNDSPRALRFFQRAIDAGSEKNDYRLLGQAYGQIGTLFAYQDLYKESMKAKCNALFYYEKSGSLKNCIHSLIGQARMYKALDNLDSALICYNKADSLSWSIGNGKLHSTVVSEKAWISYERGEKKQAQCMLWSLHSRQQGNALLCLGKICFEEEQWDSARYYLKVATKYGDLYQQMDASRCLSELEECTGNLKKALYYNNVYKAYHDSVRIMMRTETLGKIQSLYNYQHTEGENQRLVLLQADARVHMLILALMVVGLAFSLFVSYGYFRERRRESERREQELRILNERSYQRSLAYVEESRKKQLDLENQLRKAEESNDEVRRELLRLQKIKVEIYVRQTENMRQEYLLQEKVFRSSDLYRRFHEMRRGLHRVTEKDWAELRQAVDRAYPDFVQQLYALCPKLSSIELQICMLIRIAVPVSDIAYIVNRTKSAVTNARIRMYRKMTGKSGTAEAFDFFLQEL